MIHRYNIRDKKKNYGSAFKIIKQPVISEKASIYSNAGKYTFLVDINANKIGIARAFEKIFSTKVKSVNTIKSKPENRIFRGRVGKTKHYKKALITLMPGEKINISIQNES